MLRSHIERTATVLALGVLMSVAVPTLAGGHGGGHGGHAPAGHAGFNGHPGFHGHPGYYGHYHGYGYGYYGFGFGYYGYGWGGYPGYGYGPGYYPGYYAPGYDCYPPVLPLTAPPPLAVPVGEANRPTDNLAHLEIRSPGTDTEVWLNGVRTKQTGTEQRYKSPPIHPGEKYSYEVRARWTENGKPVEVTRTVLVQANERVNVELVSPAAAGENNVARFQIRSPGADTEIWLNGVRTRQTGAEQRYQTPPIPAGQAFSYQVRARWTENGKPVEVTRSVLIHSQDQLSIDLAQPTLAASR